LDLGGNYLKELPKSIVQLEKLEELYLDGDKQLDFRSAFLILGGLPRLKALHLEGNELTSLPESINNLKSLERLYLNKNELKMIKLDRAMLGKLKLLELQENQISVGSTEYLERTGVRIKF
jgi:Leucine-rich repeat (LRR) protein